MIQADIPLALYTVIGSLVSQRRTCRTSEDRISGHD